MQHSIDTHGLSLVPSQLFNERMAQHWSTISNPQMPATKALCGAWAVFDDHCRNIIISNAGTNPLKPSIVLALPTGSGKTEGACVYSALQAIANRQSGSQPVGVLIVTRLIKDAVSLTAKINNIAGTVVAATSTSHKETRLTNAEMAVADVVVITHAAFMRACWAFGVGDTSRWDAYHSWDGGKRHLVIIDEALLNSVSNHRVTSKDIDMALRAVPHGIRAASANAITTLEKLQGYLDKQEKAHTPGAETTVSLWAVGSPRLASEIEALREALGATEFAPELFADDASSNVSTVLEAVQVMLEEFAYYHRSGAQHTLNSARYLVPKEMPGVLILDATARSNMTYELLAGGVVIAEVPDGIRNYDNATLHVARSNTGMGKTKMEKAKHTRLPRLMDELHKELGPDREVFLCVHKCVKDLAATYSTEARPLRIGYWGAVDGSNEWSDCDVAVIFGLYWQDPRRPIDNVFALDGPKDSSWLKAPNYGQHENILNVISVKDVATSVIQAVNRIRIRKVIDEYGRCAKADVYIVLPKDSRGDAILRDIHLNMPGLQEVPWEFEPDGPKVYAPRPASANNAVIEMMRSREPGMTPLSYIRTQLSLTARQLGRLKEDLADAASNLTKALRDLNVMCTKQGQGRGTKVFLVKVA